MGKVNRLTFVSRLTREAKYTSCSRCFSWQVKATSYHRSILSPRTRSLPLPQFIGNCVIALFFVIQTKFQRSLASSVLLELIVCDLSLPDCALRRLVWLLSKAHLSLIYVHPMSLIPQLDFSKHWIPSNGSPTPSCLNRWRTQTV